ncbi:MAG: hypothetical protein ACO3L1_00175 [Flavobacteriaceae bacterium]
MNVESQVDYLIDAAIRNMKMDGYLVPAGVIYKPDGEALVCSIPFISRDEKSEYFLAFCRMAKKEGAIAIGFASEAWVTAHDGTDEPSDREEVIIASVITQVASSVRLVPILRDGNDNFIGTGGVRREGNVEYAEFSRGIWPEVVH